MEQTIMRIGVKAVIKGIPTPHNHCFFLFSDRFDGVTDREDLPKTPSNTQKHDDDTVRDGVTDREKLPKTPSNTQKHDEDTVLVGVNETEIETKTPTRIPFCPHDTNHVGVKMATVG